jgi:hypothetical protein
VSADKKGFHGHGGNTKVVWDDPPLYSSEIEPQVQK